MLSDRELARRTALVAWVVVAIGAGATLLVGYPQLLLLVFAAVLAAVVLDGLAAPLECYLRAPRSLAVAAAVLLLLVAGAAGLGLSGPRIARQVPALLERVPAALGRIEELAAGVGADGLLSRSWAELQDPSQWAQWTDVVWGLWRPVAGVLAAAAAALSGALVVAVTAVFLALDPERYIGGALLLVARPRRERLRAVLGQMAHALRLWLVARLVAMLAVGVLTLVGLWLLGMPLAFTLALIAGVLTFVPYVGPLAAALPALLVGLAEGPSMALYVIGLYSAVQFAENNVVTPLVQERAVSLPPALLIVLQLGLGVLFGMLGLLLASPLTVVLMVAVQAFYVRDLLGESVQVLGEDRPEQA